MMIVRKEEPYFISSGFATNATTCTMPAASEVGDTGVWCGIDNGSTIAASTGLTALGTPFDGTALSLAAGWARITVAGTGQSGDFSASTERIRSMCFRGVTEPYNATIGSGTGTTVTLPAVTINNPRSIVVCGIGTTDTVGAFTQPTTLTEIAEINSAAVHVWWGYAGPLSVWPGDTATLASSVNWTYFLCALR